MPLPALRPLDIFPVDYQGRTRFALKDTSGLTDKVLLLTAEAVIIAVALDGKNDAAGVQAAFAGQFGGAKLSEEDVLSVVRTLDENLLLDTPRFREHLETVKADYAARSRRPAAFAGAGYPDKDAELGAYLDAFFEPPGPGPAPAKEEAGELAGLVSPHIDFERGGHAYAWAYRELLSRETADLYVVLGVAHTGPDVPYVLSLKDYETPFGVVETDKELGRALCRAAGDLAEHELCHKNEHSIEFQAVWLKYAARKKGRSFRMLPLLCTSIGPGEEGHAVLEALAKLLKDYPGKVCLLAGVDLAHVGPRFGDAQPVEKLIPWMEEGDSDSLKRVLKLDAQGFYESVMEDGGKRKVCGLGALYAFTWLLKKLAPKSKGRLLRYAHAPDPSGGEVSFASLAFTR